MTSLKNEFILGVVVFTLFAGAIPHSIAQIGTTAQLSGTLTDPSDAILTGQTITLRNTETSLIRTTHSSLTGEYTFTDVTPGTYEIVTDSSGFAKLQIPVELLIGQHLELNLRLELAKTTQQASVTANAEAIDPSRTAVSEVLENRRIEDLPINGRQFLNFVLLTPNLHSGRTNISNPASPGEPNQIDLSFTGLHESTPLVLVDGANNINRVFGRARPAPPQDSVREFEVLNDTYNPSLGPAASGVVSIITKSGTNDTHGSLYEYFRNNALDARNLLAPSGFDELRQNQFGAAFGGPIAKDKVFYFANYEGQRRNESPFYSSILLNNLTAINQAKVGMGLPPEVLSGKLRQLNYDSLFSRVDDQINANNLLNATYRFRQDRDQNLPAATNQLSAPSNFRDGRVNDNAGTVNWTSTLSSQALNQATFQFSQHNFNFPSVSYEPHVQIANTLDMGRHFNAVNGAQEFRFEAADSLSYTLGRHLLRFGGTISTTKDAFSYDPYDPAYIVFPNLAGFLGQRPFTGPFVVTFGFVEGPDGTRPAAPKGWTMPANEPIFDNYTHRTNGQTNFAVFAQDQWKISRHLTLNYGLRWDVDLLPS